MSEEHARCNKRCESRGGHLTVVELRGVEAHDLRLDVRGREQRVADAHAHPFFPCISARRRRVMSQHSLRICSWARMVLINELLLPAFGEGAVRVDLEEPGLALPQLGRKVPRLRGPQALGLVDEEVPHAAGGAGLPPLRRRAELLVAVHVRPLLVLHGALVVQHARAAAREAVLLHEAHVQALGPGRLVEHIDEGGRAELIAVGADGHEHRVVVPHWVHGAAPPFQIHWNEHFFCKIIVFAPNVNRVFIVLRQVPKSTSHHPNKLCHVSLYFTMRRGRRKLLYCTISF
mmetsp:Transcript_25917/g.40834  ORF Transcript_25917/g.40834 Transcript_25917/m.40834 type:complete len:289 (+) Transcript_25917:555-1421(+)